MNYQPHLFPVSVKGVVVRNGRVLLLKNEREEWELPGGKLDLSEEPRACVAREITEEVGWAVTAGPLLDVWQYHIRPGTDVLIVTYGCHAHSSGDPVVSHEYKEAALFAEEDVPGLRIPDGYKASIAAWYEPPANQRRLRPVGMHARRAAGHRGRQRVLPLVAWLETRAADGRSRSAMVRLSSAAANPRQDLPPTQPDPLRRGWPIRPERRASNAVNVLGHGSGTNFDSHAVREAAFRQFVSDEGGGPMRANIFAGEASIRGEVYRQGNTGVFMVGIPKRNEPAAMDAHVQALDAMTQNGDREPDLGFTITEKLLQERAKVSWIRAAYLAAFAALGWLYALQRDSSRSGISSSIRTRRSCRR